MAYRKTEKVLAQQKAKRELIIACAIDVIARSGDGALIDGTAARAGVSVGLLYNYFPDRNELFNATMTYLAARHIAEMQAAAAAETTHLMALAFAIATLYRQFDSQQLVRTMAAALHYRIAIRGELERLLRLADQGVGPKDRALLAAAIMGVLFGVYDAVDAGSRNRAPTALLFVLRGVGITDAEARRILARGWGQTLAGAV